MAPKPLPSRELVRQLLRYDPRTGLLYYKEAQRRGHFRRPDNLAGCHTGGRYKVCLQGEYYHAHRLVWLIVHSEPVPDEIDHKDGDPANNRIGNLRAATRSQNNAKLQYAFRQHQRCKRRLSTCSRRLSG